MNKLMPLAPRRARGGKNGDEREAGAAASGPKTFARGLRIMEAVRNAGDEGLKIADIAATTGVQRTTVYRFLDVLVSEGYVHRSPDDRLYVFNHDRFAAAPSHKQTIELLKPVLERVSAQTGDSSFLVHREGPDSVCIHREVGSYPLQVLAVTVGHRQPLGVGAAGLALLAHLPAADLRQVLDENAPRLPEFGGMTREHMERLVRSTLERGWSAVGNAAVRGVLGVGVPVWRRPGYPAFAMSVSSVIDRMPLTRQREIVDVIRKELALVGMHAAPV